MIRELFLYTTRECRLCVEMQESLDRVLADRDITYRVIDISQDVELQHRYGARLPVLVSGNDEICELVLDLQVLESYITAAEH